MNNVEKLDKEINSLLSEKENITLLQIGANDGIDYDPIHDIVMEKEKIFCYFVEPQKETFQRLIENYRTISKRSVFINNAIFEENNEVKLFKNDNGISAHSSLLLRTNRTTENFNENSYEIVNGVTIETLLNENNISNIDVVVIDCEGYDCNIVKQILKTTETPSVIFFESPHPQPNDDRLNVVMTGPDALEDVISTLKENFYKTEILTEGIMAIKYKDNNVH